MDNMQTRLHSLQMQQLMEQRMDHRQALEITTERIINLSKNPNEDILPTIQQVGVVTGAIMLRPRRFPSMESLLQRIIIPLETARQEPPQILQLYPQPD